MGTFTRIAVHFDTPQGRRVAVVRPGSGVQAIFLDGAEATFVPGIEPARRVPPASAVSVEGQAQPETADAIDGPGVCYLIGGQLHCW